MDNYLCRSLIEIGFNPYKGVSKFESEYEYIRELDSFLKDKTLLKLDKQLYSQNVHMLFEALDAVNYIKGRTAFLEMDSLYFYLRNLVVALEEKNIIQARNNYKMFKRILLALDNIIWQYECEASG